MIVWGSFDATSVRLRTGDRYDPLLDAWTPVNTVGAPSARNSHPAVWTGSEMVIWGGFDGTSVLNSGGRYNPATDIWSSTTTVGAPVGRANTIAV
jgi:hypothetical protein